MSPRAYMSRFECGIPGCAEVANYESHTRADQTRLYQSYGQGRWRCTRHSQPDQVLSAERPKIIHEEPSYEDSHGRYWRWSRSGITYGPGFKAFAKDFPPGTILRITAEVILPDAQRCPTDAEKKMQAERCGCRGQDDYCPCQNVVQP